MLDGVTVRAASTVLVGRHEELAALRAALGRARAGEPTTVLVGGEAGVGKTRLLEEFAALAGDLEVRVLVGQCLELGEAGLPFAPFAAALREVLRRDGPDVFAGYEAEFARLLPELARVPAGIAAPTGLPVSDTPRGYLFDLVADLFGRIAEDQPLVLVIEDLHWADRSTRDLIGFLVRAARAARLLLVCTYRTDELHRGHPLRPFLAELDRARGVDRVELSRLDRDGTAAILADLLGAEPAPRAVDDVHGRTQGNPFFIEELAAAGDPVGCAVLPETLRDLLLARVDRLPEPAQRVLRIAAAGGTRFAHQLLAEVAGLPEPELEDALRAAVAAQLVVADPDGDYEFRHALVREAVHDELLPGEHARLHARYAAAIEAQPHLVAAGRAPAEIAHHWYAAHDHPRALLAARVAACAAADRYAYAEQSRLLERVLELWELVPDAADRLGMDHLRVLEETLAAATTAGDYNRALTLTRAALSEVDTDAEPLRAARLLDQRGRLLALLGKSDGTAEVRRAYELAAGVPDGPERVRLLADIAAHLAKIDPEQAGSVAAEAMVAAEAIGEDVALLPTRIAMLCRTSKTPDLGLAELRRAETLARATGNAPALVSALVHLSDVLYELGRYAESAETAAAGVSEARRFGISRSTGAYLLSNRAEALIALGRWDEADAACAEAARIDPPGVSGLHWLQLRAGLRLARAHPAADELVGRALAFLARPYLWPNHRLPLHELRIEAALAADDKLAALAASRAALADERLAHLPREGWPVLTAVARTAALTGDAGLAGEASAVAAALPARYPAEQAHAAQVAAILAGTGTGTGVGAAGGGVLAAWRVAVEAWRTAGQPYPLGRALLGLAEAAATAGDRDAVAAAVREAGEIATRLGAAPLGEQVATLARRVGLRGGGRPGPDLLTSREQEVLRLVAEGHSNSRIAERLFISPKTASVHVSRIIAKLDVRNRVEAAALAHRLGLLTSTPPEPRRPSAAS
ncbi:AAA family ATPase [Micromonospora sp. PPF5-17]|uniref:Helix-turn-helix transcriptional regulator n=1 Tax=Micromonospora solifontis TaxID=2487138 RepID=A0ABX9WFP6_9ACTN|nr:AAA family ATPase [Micromonospora sp. PPF5-17B]NES37146.1 AAA family ATPase [Micromonospora solifontis]NES54115.1 AAA family ATPase [Micromonospora sp. PPF5-6]RNL98699.1 helix-turn-helix transcriptional regulator [Micromonospora solifontis]